jgi:AraC-like DNA-binding protein
MEILILQYSILVLICFWWAKPSKKISFGKNLKLPFFNLQCFFVLLFVGGYSFLRELALKADGHWSYLLLYSAFNLCLFCMIPAGYLFARNKIALGKTGFKDLVHFSAPLIYCLFFIVPYLVAPIESFRKSPDAGLFYKVFGFSVLGIYLLLVMQFLIDKYSIFGYSAKPKKITQPELATPASPASKISPVMEVQVGSTQFDSVQLAKIDTDLRTFISAKQPFLQRGYNLRQLSEDTSIPLHHLSAFINQFYQVHYNDFINEYRVHYCQAKIRNDEWRAKTLEAIAEESGFNNRNTFTTAFKKVTGSNPSEYLKLVKQRELV